MIITALLYRYLGTGNTTEVLLKGLPSGENTNPINVNDCSVVEISQIKKTAV
jgi:hypothetical protein